MLVLVGMFLGASLGFLLCAMLFAGAAADRRDDVREFRRYLRAVEEGLGHPVGDCDKVLEAFLARLTPAEAVVWLGGELSR